MQRDLGDQLHVQVWHTTRFARASAGVCAACGVLMGLFLVVIGAADSTVRLLIPVGTLIAAAIGIAYWCCSLRPEIRLDDENLTVVNPWRRMTLPLASVRRATPGYSGINIEYHTDGQPRVLCAWAVQKANLSTWSRRRTRADAVAEAINLRAHPGNS